MLILLLAGELGLPDHLPDHLHIPNHIIVLCRQGGCGSRNRCNSLRNPRLLCDNTTTDSAAMRHVE